MNSSEHQYQTFIASVCTQFECKDAIAPLQEGFSALCEAIDNEDYDGRDSFTRCRNCGAEVYDDDLDDQGYCPDCHDVCYTDTRIPTKWDRM